MIPRDWFDWTNSGIGLTGLLLTLWAIRAATGAKRAAVLAEVGVRRHNAEGEFSNLARMAKELHGYVENGNMPEARLRTTDLRFELALAVHRHSPFLGMGAPALEDKQVALRLITDGLNRESEALSAAEKIRLLGITGAILEALASQSGELRSSVEKGAANG